MDLLHEFALKQFAGLVQFLTSRNSDIGPLNDISQFFAYRAYWTFKAISPFQNIKFLRPYHERTSDIGPVSQASKVQPVDSDPGGHWYEIDCVVNHVGRSGPNKIFNDSWIPRKNVTPLALEEYERFLTEYAKDRKDGKQGWSSIVGILYWI